MAELAAEGPFDTLLPASGEATLAALPEVARVAIAPFAGRRETVSEVLHGRIGAALPEPGRANGSVTWAGMGQWLINGSKSGQVAGWLDGLAAVTDQSDAWAAISLAGAAAPDVLARLVPLDLDPGAFPPGTAARTLLRHAPLLIIAHEAWFELLVPRSYARVAVRELGMAMRRMAGRGKVTFEQQGLSSGTGLAI